MSERRLLARARLHQLLMAAVAYVPLLLTKPGTVGADTKVYLYLDPWRLLRAAPSMWQPDTGLGTITHQNIGYLWPMGPFYWLFERTGLPDWVAQRIWMGTILIVAGLGVQYLLRTIHWEGGGVLVASFAYMLSPYVLDYVARISAILLPYAALPWLIALAAKSLRSGGWRYPALFSLVAFTAGGTNATSLLLIGIAPVLWIIHERLNDPSITTAKATLAAARIGTLTLATSIWWIVGLMTQGQYGLPVLDFTETYEVVSGAATGPEVIRGLGLWFFYGGDKLAPWIEPSEQYTQQIPFVVLSFALPLIAIFLAGVIRFRHRSFFVLLIPLGGLIAIGSHPYDAPSALGGLFKSFTTTESGLALRSTPRAVPLLILGTSVLLGAGVSTIARRRPRLELPVTIVVVVVLCFNMAPLFKGQFVGSYLSYEGDAPGYWYDAARFLDTDDQTRVLEIPGTDFSAYRWGNTVDPVTPGLIDRPYVARELVPQGTPQSAALLKALDKTMQEGTFDVDSLAPIARLMGVGDIVLRADLQYERYRTPRPNLMFADVEAAPGLGDPVTFGVTGANIAGPEQPLLDEIELAIPASTPSPPAVVIYPVRNAVPIVSTVTAERPLVIAGGAEGLVAAAGAELLTAGQAILYSASFAQAPEELQDVLDRGADLLVTDSNRRQATRWGTIRENDGYTERADESPLSYDPTDRRLAVFADAGPEAQTVAVQRNARVVASRYGNSVTYTPEHRAVFAFDGDPTTAWKVGAFEVPVGEYLEIELDEPTAFDEIYLRQPSDGNRWMTSVNVTVDGTTTAVELDDTSFTESGQRIDVSATGATTVRVTIAGTNFDDSVFVSGGVSAVGIVELSIGETTADEWIEAPRDLLAATTNDLEHRLGLLFTRDRANPSEPVRSDPEPRLKRLVVLPSDRTFAVSGEARLSAFAPQPVVDEIIGYTAVADGGIATDSSAYLAGNLESRARSAFDGSNATSWTTPFGDPTGHWIEITRPSVQPVRDLAVDVVIDDEHSIPQSFSIYADGVLSQVVEAVPSAQTSGPVTRLNLAITPFEAATVRIQIEASTPVETKDWFSDSMRAFPIAVAEVIGLGMSEPAPSRIPDTCRDGLVTIDGVSVPVRLSGTVDAAVSRQELAVIACAEDGVEVAGGVAEFESARGSDTGIDVDRLLAMSERGGGPLRVGLHPDLPDAPAVSVVTNDRDKVSVEIGASTGDYWLVLGQSQSPGWTGPFGESTLINGYANGWLVTDRDPQQVSLTFAPQRRVWFGLAATAVGLVVAAALALRGAGEYPFRRDDKWMPRLFDPTVRSRRFLRQSAMAAATVSVGIFALVNLPEWHWLAAAIAAAVLASFQGRRWAPLLPTLAAGSLAVSAAYVVLKQARNDYRTDFIWPQHFDDVHVLAVIALLLLAAESIRSMIADDDRPLDDY